MFELILRIGLSLLVVFGLMWGLARLVRRPLGGRGGAALAVLARAPLGRSSSVAVVRVVDRALLLGVTEGQVTLLGETDLAALEQQAAAPRQQATAPRQANREAAALNGSVLSPATWRQAIDVLRERTARR